MKRQATEIKLEAIQLFKDRVFGLLLYREKQFLGGAFNVASLKDKKQVFNLLVINFSDLVMSSTKLFH